MKTDKRRGFEQFPVRGWSFLTGHAQVLLAVARDPDVRVRSIAEAVGITERYAYQVLSDLQKAGYVHRERRGRRNRYSVNRDLALGDSVVEAQATRELLRLTDRSNGDEDVAAGSRWRRSA
jgi:DNA-binding IclR family transcriptional regulator